MFVEKLTDESDDSVVGKSRIECTMHINSWAICTGTFDFTGRGEIVGQGMVPFDNDAPSFDVPITGGTAEFANVRGDVHIEQISDDVERDTFHLIALEVGVVRRTSRLIPSVRRSNSDRRGRWIAPRGMTKPRSAGTAPGLRRRFRR